MTHLIKRITIWLLVLAVFATMPMGAAALESLDQTAPVSLTVLFLEEGSREGEAPVPVEDVQFDLYYVATMEGYGEFTLTGDFADYPVRLDNLDANGWKNLTSTLCNYIAADRLTPLDTGKTDENGQLEFPCTKQTLVPGLYLVNTKAKVGAEFTYRAEPFMVCLPGVNVDMTQWEYHVSARVKYTKEPNASYGTIDRRVLKVWDGDAEQICPQQVEIELRKNGQLQDTVTLNAENNWRHLWQDLPRKDSDGQPIEWSVTEKKVKDYRVSIVLEGITFQVTNTYAPEEETGDTVRRTAQKIWDDKGYETARPANVSVHLLADNEIYDTQKLNAANGWKYTWEELPAKDDKGKEIKWTIREQEISGYVANYVQMGDNVLITNSVIKPSLPQTGVLWWPVPVLAAAGLLMLILGKLLKGRSEDA